MQGGCRKLAAGWQELSSAKPRRGIVKGGGQYIYDISVYFTLVKYTRNEYIYRGGTLPLT